MDVPFALKKTDVRSAEMGMNLLMAKNVFKFKVQAILCLLLFYVSLEFLSS